MENKAVYDARPWLRFYPPGTPSDVGVPNESIPAAFDRAVQRWKDKTAIVFYGRKITYKELGDQVQKFASALYDLGVRKGDVVSLLLVNSPQFIVAFHAALKLGAIVSPISPVYVSPEIKHQLEDNGSKDLVCLDILYDKVEKTGIQLRNVILTSVGDYLPPMKKILGRTVLRSEYDKMSAPPSELFTRQGFYRFQDLIKAKVPLQLNTAIDAKTDVAVLSYTGGTTGLPKGAMLTHYNLRADELQFFSFYSSVLEEGNEVYIAIMPFYHIGGLEMAVVGGLIRGYMLVVFASVDMDDVVDAIETHQTTIFGSVPSLFESLRKYEKVDRVDWRRLKLIFTGADALLESTASGWTARTGTQLLEVYGLTETSLATHASPYGRVKKGSFGVPIPSTRAAILHPDEDKFMAVGEIGEIAIIGPQVFKGYWNNPKETEARFSDIEGEQWFRTGDLGSMDHEGYFYFYDRKRDMIKYKGYAVFAREVEEVLTAHPKIKEAGVVGVPDPSVGEIVKAIVVAEPEARGQLSEEEIRKWCEDRLAHYKIPRIIKFAGEIPKTDVGKVSRRELREDY